MYTPEEKICILLGENGVVASKFFQLLNYCGGRENFVVGFTPLNVMKVLGEAQESLCHNWNEKAEKIIKKMQSNGICAVTLFSQEFPQMLLEIPDPPFILFCKGNTKLLSSRCLAVVGTRKVSSYGKRVATDFTRVLSEHFTIVSGLAYGVDSIAHETTLKENGKTIAVFGGGLINVYPSANQNLAERIVASGGLLVSEYGTDSSPLPYRFPHRNRIVSGLSCGILVCQSPLKSGTQSTVECALDQGKDVFAVPGEIFDTGFAGNNSLIKSLQGVCVTTPRDIIDFYCLESKENAQQQSYQLNFEEQQVVEALSLGQMTFDQLVQKTQINSADLNFLLANLEIKGIIARLPGNSYRLYGGTL